ncbi:MAG: hypothetical protein KAJ64_02065 [Thermoplasmata archaeon]|nr:hypothetical protein [Thermoplasmata archaeon]
MWVRTYLFALSVGLLLIISSMAFAEAQVPEQHMEYQGYGIIMLTSTTLMSGDAAVYLRTYIDMEQGNNDGELTTQEVDSYISMRLNMGRLPTQNYKLDGYTGLFESISSSYDGIEVDNVNSIEPFTSTDVVMFYMSEGSGVEHTFSFTYMPYFVDYQYLNLSFEVPEGWKFMRASGLENEIFHDNDTFFEGRAPINVPVEITFKEIGAIDWGLAYTVLFIALLIATPIGMVYVKHKLDQRKAEKAKQKRPDCFRSYNSKIYKCTICSFKEECEIMTE